MKKEYEPEITPGWTEIIILQIQIAGSFLIQKMLIIRHLPIITPQPLNLLCEIIEIPITRNAL